ncbi:MAG: hypothetical protein IPL61_02645 [Myxococcales bacterium]|nr:hypothetical protein [Myxococcales bacterium]
MTALGPRWARAAGPAPLGPRWARAVTAMAAAAVPRGGARAAVPAARYWRGTGS